MSLIHVRSEDIQKGNSTMTTRNRNKSNVFSRNVTLGNTAHIRYIMKKYPSRRFMFQEQRARMFGGQKSIEVRGTSTRNRKYLRHRTRRKSGILVAECDVDTAACFAPIWGEGISPGFQCVDGEDIRSRSRLRMEMEVCKLLLIT